MRIIKLLVIIFLVISPFLLHIWRKNVVNRLNIKNESINEEVKLLRNTVVKLEARFREEKNPAVIEKRARELLDMRFPEKGEIINLDKLPEKKENHEY